MKHYEIVPITPEQYGKCNNIWNMEKHPHTQKWLDEIISGTRLAYAYSINNEFLGQCDLVTENNDPDYTIPNKRAYISRLSVKETQRNKGIGSILMDYIIALASEIGFSELSIGVNKDNHIALHLYKSKGFTEILFEGEDKYGEFYKLLKIL